MPDTKPTIPEAQEVEAEIVENKAIDILFGMSIESKRDSSAASLPDPLLSSDNQ